MSKLGVEAFVCFFRFVEKKQPLDFLSIEQKSEFFYGGKDEILQRSVAAEQF